MEIDKKLADGILPDPYAINTYDANLLCVLTDSTNIRPPRIVLDYLINELNYTGLSTSICAEKILSYAGDIMLSEVLERNPTKPYERLNNKTIPALLDQIMQLNWISNNWERRLIDVHSKTNPQYVAGIVVFGLTYDQYIKSPIRLPALRIVTKHGLDYECDLEGRLFMEEISGGTLTQSHKLTLSTVVKNLRRSSLKQVYYSQYEYAVEVWKLQNELMLQSKDFVN